MPNMSFFNKYLSSRVWKLPKLNETILTKQFESFELAKITEFKLASYGNDEL